MKAFIYFTLLLTAISLSACIGPDSPIPTSKHYIRGFVNAASIHADISYRISPAPESTPLSHNDFSVYVRPDGAPGDMHKDQVSPEQAEQLYIQFKDVDYNRWDIQGPVLYRQTLSLDIVSDTPYDGAHPAGTLLNDIFNCSYQCVDEILNPPYNFSRSEEQKALNLSAGEFIERLSVFNLKKPTLIVYNFYLSPVVPPAETSTHRFTVTYKNIDGVELTATTEPVTIHP